MDEAQLRDRLARVQEQIGRASARAGRADPVTIVAVTKGHPPSVVRAAIAAGMERCGENRVSELEEKVGQVGRHVVEWHLIGHLQRNKVRRALPLFDLIHSIDSERLAQEISVEAQRSGGTVRGLVQVNISGETSKGGFNAADAVAALVEPIQRVADLPGLDVVGLMTMAPFTEEETVLRRTFSRARQLFEHCSRDVRGFDARYLSMGMSNDFEVAVEEGSTMVRLGTILFGERQT